MFEKTKGFTSKRIAEHARTADVVDRAKAATNSAVSQATDRLGTPGLGKAIL